MAEVNVTMIIEEKTKEVNHASVHESYVITGKTNAVGQSMTVTLTINSGNAGLDAELLKIAMAGVKMGG